MDSDIKREARKQYLHYFRPWFIAIAILLAACAALQIGRMTANGSKVRSNHNAPSERVYDFADVMTDKEEEKLRKIIAKYEKKYGIDIVLMTIRQPVEGEAAKEQYGYRSTDWDNNMTDIADNFWDENKFGFDRDFEGDGVMLLHNWYEGQDGYHLNTSGIVERTFSIWDLEEVLDAVDKYYYKGKPYRAYKAYVEQVGKLLEGGYVAPIPWTFILVVPLVAAFIYAAVHRKKNKAQNTTTVNTYVADGKPVVLDKSDEFLRKSVTFRRIESGGSSGGGGRSGGGSRSSGGGGHHVSRSGASHGGASRRH